MYHFGIEGYRVLVDRKDIVHFATMCFIEFARNLKYFFPDGKINNVQLIMHIE